MIETEQVAGNITNNFYLVDDLAGMFFFFNLLFDEPLEHLERCVIFFLGCKIYKPVDHCRNLLLMDTHFIEYFSC